MAQTVLWGTDATLTMPGGIGCMFNAFTYNLTQSVAEATGFGFPDAQSHGAVRRATGTLSGVMTKGTANDVPGHALVVPASASLTLQFIAGCTLVFKVVFSALNLGVALEAADQTSLGWTRDGVTTETWATT